MNIQEALELLGAVGSDNAPTVEQLKSCRSVLIDAAKVAKEQSDKVALSSMLEAIKVADRAIKEGEELEAKEAEELNSLVADIPELAGEASEASAEASEESAASEDTPRLLSLDEAVQRLGLGQSTAPAVEVTEREPAQTLRINGEDRSDATWDQLGAEFHKSAKQSLRGGRTTVATFQTNYTNKLSGKTGENTRVLDSLGRQAGDDAVLAAGGCCSLAEPLRDQPMLASLSRPIADSLPTVGTTAGAVSFFAPICLPQGGVGHWTCEDDENVDANDPDTWKECSEVECDDVQEVVVDAIYRCLTIGNFQHRFTPERWDAILHATTAAQARMAEKALYDAIAGSEFTEAKTVNDLGSAYATMINAYLRAAAIIRTNQRYEGVRLKAIAPGWARDAALLDATNRAIASGRATDAEAVDVVLARHGIDITWSDDLDEFESDGAELGDFPEEFKTVIYADGGVFRLDGGEINLGTEIRDHDLNRQNKLAAFAESFETAVVRSCETLELTIPVSVCTDVPCVVPVGGGEG